MSRTNKSRVVRGKSPVKRRDAAGVPSATMVQRADIAEAEDENSSPLNQKGAKKKNLRLTITFPPKSVEELDVLKSDIGTDSNAEVVRAAFSLFKMVMSERRKGSKVVMKRKDGTEVEFMLPY